MKHLSVIFITLSIILSVIACILPNWSTTTSPSNTGLFITCDERDSFNPICSPTHAGNGLLPAKIFSMAGPVLLAISAVLCGMGQNKGWVLSTLVGGIACLTATLIIFAVSYAPSIEPGCVSSDDLLATCPSLSTSWYLELGAVIVAIIGVVIKVRSSTIAII